MTARLEGEDIGFVAFEIVGGAEPFDGGLKATFQGPRWDEARETVQLGAVAAQPFHFALRGPPTMLLTFDRHLAADEPRDQLHEVANGDLTPGPDIDGLARRDRTIRER